MNLCIKTLQNEVNSASNINATQNKDIATVKADIKSMNIVDTCSALSDLLIICHQ